jgi:4-alpha-glucanotransferase
MEVRLEEVFGVPEQQNLPGTQTEHPNWRVKFPLTLDQMEQAPELARLAARLNKARGPVQDSGQGSGVRGQEKKPLSTDN